MKIDRIIQLIGLIYGFIAYFLFILILIGMLGAIIIYREKPIKLRVREVLMKSLAGKILLGTIVYIVATSILYLSGFLSMSTLLILFVGLSVLLGSFYHTAVGEFGSIVGGLYATLLLGPTLDTIYKLGLLMTLTYILGFASSRFLRGLIKYSYNGIVLYLHREKIDMPATEEIERKLKETTINGKNIDIKRLQVTGKIGVINKSVAIHPEFRIDFEYTGNVVRPFMDTIKRTLRNKGNYLPAAFKQTPHITSSTAIDTFITISIAPKVKGSIHYTEEGLRLVLMSAEITSTKMYSSPRSRVLLLKAEKEIMSKLNELGFHVRKRIPSKGGVFVYQTTPYREVGELEPAAKGTATEIEMQEFIKGISAINEIFFVETLLEKTRRGIIKKILATAAATLISYILSYFGISI